MTRPSPTDGAVAGPAAPGDRCPHCGAEVEGTWLVCAWCGEALAAPAELPAGARLGDDRFEVRGVLGRGGFGITYEVLDRRLERRVAIKELFPEAAVRHGSLVLAPPQARPAFRAARDRFLREARVLARFNHPGIVRVFEVFEEHGTAYLVMELLEGRTLVELLRQRNGPFTEAEVLDVAGWVGQALRPVHLAGILHRDVNPSNIVMTDQGRMVLIDFGLARDFEAHQTMGMTRVVTPGYAPLEQYVGSGRFGPSSDVYGLAATLYRLATGAVPVPALDREGGKDLESPHRRNPGISKPVSDAVLDGLELQPAHRPASLEDFTRRLGIHEPPAGRSILLAALPPTKGRADVGLTRAPATPIVAAGAAAAGAGAGASPTNDRPHAPGEGDEPGPAAAPGSAVADGPAAAAPIDRDSPTDLVARRPPAASPLAGPDGPEATVPGVVRPSLDGPDRDPGRPSVPDGTPGGAATHAVPGTRAYAPAAVPAAPVPVAPVPVVGERSQQEPPIVGLDRRPGRRGVLLPVAAAAIALTTAAPVALTLLLVLVALPALATWGDWLVHRDRRRTATAERWIDRSLHPTVAVPHRFIGNLAVSVVRSVPVLALGVVMVAGWYGLEAVTDSESLLTGTIRAIGLVMGLVLVLPARRDRTRFRTGRACDHLVDLVARRSARVTQRLVVWWVVWASVVAFALWLTADLWPLDH